jgi:CBS domain containing-hemolysin-like protein
MNDTFRKSINWSLAIAVITFVLAAIFSIVSTYTLSGVTWAMGMFIVLIIVFVGIFFDMLGVAATAADEIPFHAMASERVKGARHAILIVRNADRFANFCNDVIGDISGIISGTASAIVLIQLSLSLNVAENGPTQFIISIVFTSVIAALTVGGKAFGKTIAIQLSTKIVFQVGKLFYFTENRLKIRVLNDKREKKKNQKLKRK